MLRVTQKECLSSFGCFFPLPHHIHYNVAHSPRNMIRICSYTLSVRRRSIFFPGSSLSSVCVCVCNIGITHLNPVSSTPILWFRVFPYPFKR